MRPRLRNEMIMTSFVQKKMEKVVDVEWNGVGLKGLWKYQRVGYNFGKWPTNLF